MMEGKWFKPFVALVVFAIALFWQFLPSESCSCAPSHPQTSFCNADFVIKAKVKGSKLTYEDTDSEKDSKPKVKKQGVDKPELETPPPSLRIYSIRVNRVFKEAPGHDLTNLRRLYTAADGGMCGIQLKNGTKYVLEGHLIDGRAHISICDHATEWSELSVRQRKGYNYLYEQHCDCKVKVCWSSKCHKKEHEDDSCFWNMREDPGNCYSKHAMCMRRDDGLCRWSRPQLWKQCQEKVRQDRMNEP